MIDLKIPKLLLTLRFVDCVIWMMPPALPVNMGLNHLFSLWRLVQSEILGTDADKTIVAGSVDVCCFDKTGTLTSNSIDVFGYSCSDLSVLHRDRGRVHEDRDLFRLMAVCHSCHLIGGELLGDSLDIAMFKHSGYTIDPENGGDAAHLRLRVRSEQLADELEVSQVFDFESDLQRMSCVVRDARSGESWSFVKGSPEAMRPLFGEAQIPVHYSAFLLHLANQGLRVIALGRKRLQDAPVSSLTVLERVEAESGLEFLGFIAFENGLKSDTAEVIGRLQKADLRCKVLK